MISSDKNEQFQHLTKALDYFKPVDWDDIVDLLKQIRNKNKSSLIPSSEDALLRFAKGTAFITFNYGIDGVTIETLKYAHILDEIFTPFENPSIHFIGGNFQPQIFSLLRDEWRWFQLDGIDGWNKWDDGKWFKALFKNKMKSESAESNLLTKEIYKQAVSIAKRLGKYFLDNQISLIMPINIASNPGNIAFTLGFVLVAEILGLYVINSNHDFYWEAGKPLSEREPGEAPGVRDHFFRNIKNTTFFSLFEMLFPWNGSRWLQVNINARQSRKLIKTYGFPREKVFEISTCLADSFFESYNPNEVANIRLRMGHILSGGEAIMQPVPIADHLTRVDQWMINQQPIILGARPGLSVDPRSEDLTILLQPTRVVGRKRIERNLDLIGALFQKTSLRNEFENNPNRQLILHITGPVPKEHQGDLEKVLTAYNKIIHTLPKLLAERIFLAFSVGQETHTSFSVSQFDALTIESIYRMADVVVFPSKTEGRGLPIIEACASGIPIICSQYRPKEVFCDVIGDKLADNLQIRYTLFPEGAFDQTFLSDVARLIIHPGDKQNHIMHNKEAVRVRYNYAALKTKFERLINHIYQLDQGV